MLAIKGYDRDNHKERQIEARFIKLLKEDNMSEVYNYLYTLDIDQLIDLFNETNINVYTPFMIKRLIICDSREKIKEKRENV